jgi:hypothetical protein
MGREEINVALFVLSRVLFVNNMDLVDVTALEA